MTNTPTNDPSFEQLSFEDALKRLEEIVRALEDGRLGLAESLEQYEEGVKLLRQSYDLLQRAERQIEILSGVDAEGNPITRPFDDTATFNSEQVDNLSHEETPSKRRSRRRSTPTLLPDDDP